LLTEGEALTVIVNDKKDPLQPFAVGNTAIALTPGFVVVNEGIFPVPLAANPIEVLLFDQA